MQQSNKAVIVFSIQSLMDPLFQGLMYQYMRIHNEQYSGYIFHLFTEEHPEYRLSDEAVAAKKASLLQQGIVWHPLNYRKGRFLILKKAWSVLVFLWKIRAVKRQHKATNIIGFLIMASAYGYFASKLFGLNLHTFCFEPHSLYMKEFGIWSEKSLKYKILNFLEYRTAKASKQLTAPTIHTVKLLEEWQIKGKISNVPISVDTDKFTFSEKDRTRIRNRYKISEDRYVLLYLGKFNGIYYSEQAVAKFCKRLLAFDPRIFFLTISPSPSEEIAAAYLEVGLAQTDFVVLNKIPYDEIEGYISAADMGMLAIPPLDSQKYRTPVKIGNYLACGIPFMLNKGIADDDIMAEKEQVGVVLESLEAEDLSVPLQQLKAFMEEERTSLQARCRAAAIQYRGIQNSVTVLHEMIQD